MNTKNRIYLILIGIGCLLGFGIANLISRPHCGAGKGGSEAPAVKPHSSISISAVKGISPLIPILIIGSGPAGNAAGIYGGRAEIPTYIAEGDNPGGLLMQTTEVENWPGERSITGPLLIDKLHDQAAALGAKFMPGLILSINTNTWPYEVLLEDNKRVYALTIIIATGSSPVRLQIPGETEYWGKGVTACAICDAWFFKGKKVVVVGGGDSAIEEATILARHAQEVTILVRKNKMRAAASGQSRLKGFTNVSIKYSTEIRKIIGNGNEVTAIELIDSETKKTSEMPIDGVFLAIGHTPNTVFLKGVVPLDEAGRIKIIGRSQATTIPGIFAAGDVEDGTYRQAVVAAGSGVKALLDAQAFLTHIGYDEYWAQVVKDNLYQAEDIIEEQQEPESLPGIMTATSISELEELMKAAADKVVIIDFFAEHCAACMHMMPMLEELAHERSSDIVIIKIDTDQAVDVAQRYMVRKLPTILVFWQGQLAGRFIRPATKQELSDIITSARKV